MVLQPNQIRAHNRSVTPEIIQRASVLATVSNDTDGTLTDIKGIGEGTQKILKEGWIKTKTDLLNTTEEEIRKMVKNPLSLKGVLNFINKENLWEILKTTDLSNETS